MTKPSEPLAGSFEMEPKRVLVVDDDPGVPLAFSLLRGELEEYPQNAPIQLP